MTGDAFAIQQEGLSGQECCVTRERTVRSRADWWNVKDLGSCEQAHQKNMLMEGTFRLAFLFTVASPLREHWSDNLARGAKIVCPSQSGARRPLNAYSSTRQWSMPKVSGAKRSTISGQRAVSDDCTMANVHPDILASSVIKVIPNTWSS